MIYTNKYNLPDRVIKVIKGNRKDKPPDINRMSVTDLIDEPLPRSLYINQWDKIIRDYSDFLTMVQGTALHERYEMVAGDDDDAEHKFEDKIGNYTLVGMADNYFDKTILDVKQTSCYGPQYKIDKWTAQTNIYAWQRRKRGMEVNKILIDVWYRNWKEGNKYWKNYPQIPYECIELDLWTFEQQQAYIESQIEYHYMNPMVECSNKQKGIRYEAYKGNNKTPSKVGDTREEVQEWVRKQPNSLVFTIKTGKPVFCMLYCKAGSVCPYNKRELENE